MLFLLFISLCIVTGAANADYVVNAIYRDYTYYTGNAGLTRGKVLSEFTTLLQGEFPSSSISGGDPTQRRLKLKGASRTTNGVAFDYESDYFNFRYLNKTGINCSPGAITEVFEDVIPRALAKCASSSVGLPGGNQILSISASPPADSSLLIINIPVSGTYNSC